MLPLSEGQAGEGCDFLKIDALSALPKKKVSITSPMYVRLVFSSITFTPPPSLSMNLKTVKATKGAGFFYVYRSTNIIMIEK
jgi:hypothetical protein